MDRRRPPTRILVLAIVAALWMGAVDGRLSYLQLFRYSDYLARARRQQQRIVEVSPLRGVLYDRNERELAMSMSLDSCFAVPAEISDPAMVARLLSEVLGTQPEEIETRLGGSRSFVWIARKLAPEKVARIQDLNLRGVYFQKENGRFYPKGELAAHVLGYVDIDDRGLGGIEYQFEKELRSPASRMLVLADARRRWYERRGANEDRGSSLVLTLDENIQYIAEKELRAAIEKTHARAGTAIVEDPNNGELLAIANWPTFDPNTAGGSAPEARMDRAISALYEPGSTFKIITLAAALEEGLTRPDEPVDCQMGQIYIGKHRIRDHKPFGVLTVAQILAHSSDVGAIKMGLRLGPEKLHQYIRAFGFGAPTGIELPGETRGIVRRVESWSAISIGAVSMGQEVGVTPVQLANAISSIANGGLLYRPRVVRGVRRGTEMVPEAEEPGTRVVRPETAATLRRMLEGVILEGTGRRARLNGYTAGGKTGTAQKIDPATGRYSPHDYIASFVGFAPLNSPAVTVLIALDSPVGPHEGGEVAAPVFQQVMQQTLAYLRVAPDVPLNSPFDQTSGRLEQTAKEEDVSDFGPGQAADASEATSASDDLAPEEPRKLSGSPAGAKATAVALGEKSPAPTVVVEEGEGTAVPQFAGMTVRSFIEECVRLGFNPVPVGTGIAVDQLPEPGARLRPGSRVVVHFAPRAPVEPALKSVAQKGKKT
jgi:cell division protein FtsI (penicillin-binding protein 3)